jgi:hypothetical protein
MSRALALLLLATLPLGCASTGPPPEARGVPQTAAVPASPVRAPLPPATPLPPAPQISPHIDNEDQAVRDVKARLARADEVMGQIDSSKLGNEQQEMLSGLKDFISKATEALRARDVPRAQVLADKASRLADDLALAVKNGKVTR